jgi:hypothetical protein
MQRIFINKYFLFMLRNVCRVKPFHLGGKCFADEEEVEMKTRKWLRQQSYGHLRMLRFRMVEF